MKMESQSYGLTIRPCEFPEGRHTPGVRIDSTSGETTITIGPEGRIDTGDGYLLLTGDASIEALEGGGYVIRIPGNPFDPGLPVMFAGSDDGSDDTPG